jgi:TPR repeat protein
MKIFEKTGLNAKKNPILRKLKKLCDEGKVLEAAKLGLPEAQGMMANNYWQGENGFEKDVKKGFELAKLAAEEGDRFGQSLLGCVYLGEGIEKDVVAALKWFELAAEQGCLASMHNIGIIYHAGGFGIEKDIDAAFTWFKKGADSGDDEAQYRLASMYYDGISVAARSWFKKSSDQGFGHAQRKLGMMMATGKGGAREYLQGLALVEAAAGQGDIVAIELMRDHHAITDGL